LEIPKIQFFINISSGPEDENYESIISILIAKRKRTVSRNLIRKKSKKLIEEFVIVDEFLFLNKRHVVNRDLKEKIIIFEKKN
jgi:hypothetical protein